MKILSTVLFLFLAFLGYSQSLNADWEGNWKGTVEIWSYNEKVDAFPMSLDIIRKDSIWDFIINYQRQADQTDIRAYQLIVVDESKNHFAIDEKNSIILDAFLNANCLYNRFSGMGSDLQVRMCLEPDGMSYEITSTFAQALRTSGNEVIGNDTIPEIKSYDLYNLMKAKLKKE